jgi:hypothetical protein
MVPQDDQVTALARFTIRGLHDVALFIAGDGPVVRNISTSAVWLD